MSNADMETNNQNPWRKKAYSRDDSLMPKIWVPIVRAFKDRVQNTWLRSIWRWPLVYLRRNEPKSWARFCYLHFQKLKCTWELMIWCERLPAAAMRKCHKAYRWLWSPLPSRTTSESLIDGNGHCELSLQKLIGDFFRLARSFSTAHISGLWKTRARFEGILASLCSNRF